ncbi:MAG: MaoC family dehydratase N-terminal domain-containing protein [Deltaproteobacteria bacterium]|nr:MaoC family dehydratase N-terminal domain-containing protein [Deltaproteobacteria bacterium]
MIHVDIPSGLLGRVVDLGQVTITREMIAGYVRAVGDRHDDTIAPPTYCLVLRRGMTPEIDLARGTFGVYGGHDLEFRQSLRAGETYHLSGRVVDVYEKSGRGGPMAVVVREAEVRTPGGELVVRIVERQIVRQVPREQSRPPSPAKVESQPQALRPANPPSPLSSEPEPGAELNPWRRATPSPEAVASYVGSSQMREGLFVDADYARSLGYRGIVVPGPMLTAFIEQFLRQQLAGWRIERLSTTFRVPTISGDALLLQGAVTERHAMADGEHILCDIIIEHDNGDRAVTATATLRRVRSVGSV